MEYEKCSLGIIKVTLQNWKKNQFNFLLNSWTDFVTYLYFYIFASKNVAINQTL